MSSDTPTVSSMTGGAASDGGFFGGLINSSIASALHPSFTNIGQTVTGGTHGATELLGSHPAPTPISPGAPPTVADANVVALHGELSQEQKMASASTILTGGEGLNDQPATASRVLLGS